MNEELKKMLDSINAKKQEVKDLCKAGKIEDGGNRKGRIKRNCRRSSILSMILT